MGLSYFAPELPCYWEESNETFPSERIYVKVVHLGIGFIERRKCVCRIWSKSTIFQIVGLSYSTLDQLYHAEKSNEMLHGKRIYIVGVHLGIGFIKRQKVCL